MMFRLLAVFTVFHLMTVVTFGKAISTNPSAETVVTYHPIATQIGYDILKNGGNAFDAFIAATAAQYVLGEGVTSLGGPLGALLYDAKSKKTIYLDAGFNDPLDPRHKWDPANPQPGSAALVPGAVAGLEAISERYGKFSFSRVLKPAIKLAKKGFPLNKLYAHLLTSEFGNMLKKTAYGSKTYFKDGKPLNEGDLLKLPEVAEFLQKVADHGSAYVYRGAWAKKCIEAINTSGGHITPADFSSYKVIWGEPWHVSYRGYEVYSPSGRTNGGINTLLALKVLEHTDITKYGAHYSTSADALEVMTRVQTEVAAEPWLYDQTKLDDTAFVSSVLTSGYADKIWERVQQKLASTTTPSEGTHSYHVVVMDSEGNAITGTNTIESLPWGKGLFVDGIPLTDDSITPSFSTKPGERRRSPLSMQIGIKNDKVQFASGAFSASLIPAAFQFVVNIVDYKLSAKAVVSLPRIGDQAWDIQTQKLLGALWLDYRIDKTIVNTLASRGLKFIQEGYLDTGLGSVGVRHEDGTVDGAFAPLSSIGFTPGFNH
jgi:gamma-glutamyltranspeptidase/glutathione hydrolase